VKGGKENGRSYHEECSKEGKGLYVLCGWKRKSLSRKDGPGWKEKKKKIIVNGIRNFMIGIGLVSYGCQPYFFNV